MQTVNSLDALILPQKHRGFLEVFISIERLILFGSCARGEATEQSDIDIAALGENIDDETLWELYDCAPEYYSAQYVDNDILAIKNKIFYENTDSFGMVQKYIEKDGVDLSELFQQGNRAQKSP